MFQYTPFRLYVILVCSENTIECFIKHVKEIERVYPDDTPQQIAHKVRMCGKYSTKLHRVMYGKVCELQESLVPSMFYHSHKRPSCSESSVSGYALRFYTSEFWTRI